MRWAKGRKMEIIKKQKKQERINTRTKRMKYE